MEMNKILEEYKNYLEINGSSSLTIKNYIGRIQKFLKKVTIKEITEKKVMSFILELDKISKPSTSNGYRASISSFLKFLKKDIAIPKLLKLDKTLPDSISEEYFKKEIIPVVECIFEKPLKVKAILYFAFYTGVRRRELANLKREHIDLTSRTAKVYGKRKKERIIFFTKEVAEILRSYFASENEETNAFNIGNAGLGDIFERAKPYFKKINFRFYLLRHSFATMFVNNGGDIAILSRILGHNSITTTMRYIGVETTKMKEIYDRNIGR